MNLYKVSCRVRSESPTSRLSSVLVTARNEREAITATKKDLSKFNLSFPNSEESWEVTLIYTDLRNGMIINFEFA